MFVCHLSMRGAVKLEVTQIWQALLHRVRLLDKRRKMTYARITQRYEQGNIFKARSGVI